MSNKYEVRIWEQVNRELTIVCELPTGATEDDLHAYLCDDWEQPEWQKCKGYDDMEINEITDVAADVRLEFDGGGNLVDSAASPTICAIPENQN